MKDARNIKNRQKVNQLFNEMPFECRKIAVDAELVSRIQDLLLLKNRLKENYEREVKYIDERIKSYNSGISN